MYKMLKMKKFLCEYESIISYVPSRAHPAWSFGTDFPLNLEQAIGGDHKVVFIHTISTSVISHGVIVHAVREDCGVELGGWLYMDTFSAPRSLAKLLSFRCDYINNTIVRYC